MPAEHGDVQATDVTGAVDAEASYDDVTLTRIGGAGEVAVSHGGLQRARPREGRARARPRRRGRARGLPRPRRRGGGARGACASCPRARSPRRSRSRATHGGIELEVPAGSRFDLEASAAPARVTADVPGLSATHAERAPAQRPRSAAAAPPVDAHARATATCVLRGASAVAARRLRSSRSPRFYARHRARHRFFFALRRRSEQRRRENSLLRRVCASSRLPPLSIRTHERPRRFLDSSSQTSIPELPLWRRGKVRDVYDLGDRLLIVATDRISAFDVVLPTPHPATRARCSPSSRSSGSACSSDVVPNHVITGRRGRLRPASCARYRDQLEGRSMLVREDGAVARRVRGARLPAARAGRTTSATGAVCGIALPAGPARVGAARAADLHALHQGRDRPRREHLASTQMAEHRGRRRARRSCATLSLELYARARAHAEARGIILADTKFEFGVQRRPRWSGSTRPHARLVALLAARTATQPGRGAAELRQAVRARLPGDAGLGQAAARPRPAGGRRGAHAREVPRGLRAPDRHSADRARRVEPAAAETRGDGDHRRLAGRGADSQASSAIGPPPSAASAAD